MKALIPIEDWQQNVAQRGKATGNVIVIRRVIATDSWNWVLGMEKKDGLVTGQRFYPNLRLLLPALFRLDGIVIENVVKSLISELNRRLNKKFDAKIEVSSESKISDFGTMMDEVFDTSFTSKVHPPTVTKRLFGSNDDTEDTNTEVELTAAD